MIRVLKHTLSPTIVIGVLPVIMSILFENSSSHILDIFLSRFLKRRQSLCLNLLIKIKSFSINWWEIGKITQAGPNPNTTPPRQDRLQPMMIFRSLRSIAILMVCFLDWYPYRIRVLHPINCLTIPIFNGPRVTLTLYRVGSYASARSSWKFEKVPCCMLKCFPEDLHEHFDHPVPCLVVRPLSTKILGNE